jgi:Tfp pilus assembly protein PilN
MRSPLARVIAAILGGYGMMLLLLWVHDWVKDAFPRPPHEAPNSARIQHPISHSTAVRALRRFYHLPEAERRALKANLEAALIPTRAWLVALDGSDYQVICLGEFHAEITRRYLAEVVLGNLSFDNLLLEATPSSMRRLKRWMAAGRGYVPLQGADISRSLQAARRRNPGLELFGIEETDAQADASDDAAGARDRAIARNFWRRYQPRQRHLILFGALHCANTTDWLFDNLRRQAPNALKTQMINAQVLGEHQHGALEAFVYFLDEIGIRAADFVISDTRSLPPQIYTWFPSLHEQILSKYTAVVLFRSFGAQ